MPSTDQVSAGSGRHLRLAADSPSAPSKAITWPERQSCKDFAFQPDADGRSWNRHLAARWQSPRLQNRTVDSSNLGF